MAVKPLKTFWINNVKVSNWKASFHISPFDGWNFETVWKWPSLYQINIFCPSYWSCFYCSSSLSLSLHPIWYKSLLDVILCNTWTSNKYSGPKWPQNPLLFWYKGEFLLRIFSFISHNVILFAHLNKYPHIY